MMLKKIIPQILSAVFVGILINGLTIKFQSRIEALTETQTLVISIILLALAAISLAIPSIIIRLNKSPEAKAKLVSWGFLFYIHLSIILFATLSVTALLFLASTKLPTRENLPYYLVNVGPFLGLIGLISHILLNAGQYLASATRVKFFDLSIASDILLFIFIAWAIYAFPDKPINPVISILSIGLGISSFGFALGSFTGHFMGTEQFIREIALKMREKDAQLQAKDKKLKFISQTKSSFRKRKNNKK